jgi:hypothetical protein
MNIGEKRRHYHQVITVTMKTRCKNLRSRLIRRAFSIPVIGQ